jgi:TatD DNase family protein
VIFDTHAHYYSKEFDEDRDELLRRLHDECGVCAIVNAAENMERSRQCMALAEQYDFIYAAVGLHPNCAGEWRDSYLDDYRQMLAHPKVVAVGEAGLDYYRVKDNREEQQRVFCWQLELARDVGKPIIIHDREAHGDMYRILRQYRPDGVLHCFSGSVELAREALADGLYIGMGGSVTFPHAVQPVAVARYVPLDRLVLETDAPYLIPTPCRRKPTGRERSDSSMIYVVAECIARLRGMDTEELLAITEQNARRLYQL